MKSLLVLQLKDYGAALTAVQESDLYPSLEILEVFHLGKTAQIFAVGSEVELIAFRKNLATADLDKSVIINQMHSNLLNTIWHLESSKLVDDLVILESEFVGDVLNACNKCLIRNMQVIDFRHPKFSGSISYVLLNCENASEDIFQEAEFSKVKFRWVSKPNEKLKKFFI